MDSSPTGSSSNWVHRILSAPRRMARSKGFGIHSPFAYTFVRHVVNQPCTYYIYSELGAGMPRASRRMLRLLFRTSLFLRPDIVATTGSVPPETSHAILGGTPHARISTGQQPDLLVAGPGADCRQTLECLHSGGTVFLTSMHSNAMQQLTEHLWQHTECGMLFKGNGNAIFIGKKTLPHQLFDLWM